MGFMRPATQEDALYLAPRLREADSREVRALTGLPPEAVVPQCLEASDAAWTGCADGGEPAFICGTQPVFGVPDVGWVWMVGSDLIFKHRWELLNRSKEALPLVHSRYPILTNHVDERNTLHIQWLRWMGFSFLRRIERWGAAGIPFLEFARLDTSKT